MTIHLIYLFSESVISPDLQWVVYTLNHVTFTKSSEVFAGNFEEITSYTLLGSEREQLLYKLGTRVGSNARTYERSM